MQKCAHLVDFERCCKTKIYLQRSASMQPRTSPPKVDRKNLIKLLERITQNLQKFTRGLGRVTDRGDIELRPRLLRPSLQDAPKYGSKLVCFGVSTAITTLCRPSSWPRLPCRRKLCPYLSSEVIFSLVIDVHCDMTFACEKTH